MIHMSNQLTLTKSHPNIIVFMAKIKAKCQREHNNLEKVMHLKKSLEIEKRIKNKNLIVILCELL
jgi:hypothetical protein